MKPLISHSARRIGINDVPHLELNYIRDALRIERLTLIESRSDLTVWVVIVRMRLQFVDELMMLLDEVAGLLEILFGLAGKAYNPVGCRSYTFARQGLQDVGDDIRRRHLVH